MYVGLLIILSSRESYFLLFFLKWLGKMATEQLAVCDSWRVAPETKFVYMNPKTFAEVQLHL